MFQRPLLPNEASALLWLKWGRTAGSKRWKEVFKSGSEQLEVSQIQVMRPFSSETTMVTWGPPMLRPPILSRCSGLGDILHLLATWPWRIVRKPLPCFLSEVSQTWQTVVEHALYHVFFTYSETNLILEGLVVFSWPGEEHSVVQHMMVSQRWHIKTVHGTAEKIDAWAILNHDNHSIF